MAKSPRRAGCNRPGGRAVVDVALQGSGIVSRRAARPGESSATPADGRRRFPSRHACCRALRFWLSSAVSSSLWFGDLYRRCGRSAWASSMKTSGTRSPRNLGPWPHLWHRGDLSYRDVDRGSCPPRHRDFPHRTLSRVVRHPIGTAIELLAGIPSIIYGIGAFSSSLRSSNGPAALPDFDIQGCSSPLTASLPARPMASAF